MRSFYKHIKIIVLLILAGAASVGVYSQPLATGAFAADAVMRVQNGDTTFSGSRACFVIVFDEVTVAKNKDTKTTYQVIQKVREYDPSRQSYRMIALPDRRDYQIMFYTKKITDDFYHLIFKFPGDILVEYGAWKVDLSKE